MAHHGLAGCFLKLALLCWALEGHAQFTSTAELLPQNLWPNPTLELDGDGDGVPDFWRRAGSEKGALLWDTNPSVSPPHSLLVDDQSVTGYGEWESGLLPVQSGKAYRLRFWRRYDCNGEMRLSVNFHNETDYLNSIHFVVAGQQKAWELVNAEIVVPAKASRLGIAIASGGSAEVRGTIWVDDISLGLITGPPWWEAGWFWGAAGLALAGLVAGTTRYVSERRLRRRLERLRQEHALEKERNRIARDIHDHLGASLTQISLLSELARNNLSDPPHAEADLHQISEKARELMRSMDEIVWAVDPQNDSLESFTSYACTHAQNFLNLAGLRCRMEVPTALPGLPLSSETRHHVFLGLKEALTNVVRHAAATEVRVRLSVESERVVLCVEDDGRGFDPAAVKVPDGDGARPGAGHGLGNLRQRMEDIGGGFELKSEPNRGTSVRLTAPAQAS